jgi:hypothetical protein
LTKSLPGQGKNKSIMYCGNTLDNAMVMPIIHHINKNRNGKQRLFHLSFCVVQILMIKEMPA